MRKPVQQTALLPCVLFLFFSSALSAQDVQIRVKQDKRVTPAAFPGGQDAIYCFFEEHWDAEFIKDVDSGRVLLYLLIDKTGAVESTYYDVIQSVKSTDKTRVTAPAVEREVLDVIEQMPSWEPERFKRRPRSGHYTILLVFPYTNQCGQAVESD